MTTPVRVSITGRVTVRLPDEPPIEIAGQGRSLVIDFARLPALPTSSSKQSATPVDRSQSIERLDAALRRLDFTLDVRLDGQRLARIGPGAEPTFTARLLGLGPIELHGLTAVRAWLGV